MFNDRAEPGAADEILILQAHPLLSQANTLLVRCLDYEATIQAIAELAVQSFAGWCIVDIVGEDGRIERVAAAHPDPSKLDLINRIRERYPASPGAGRGVYKVVQTGKSILIPELTEEMMRSRADDAEHLRLMRELGLGSYMCVPLIAHRRTIGTILLFSSTRRYDNSDLWIAEELAQRFALAADNARIHRKAQEAIRVRDKLLAELARSYDLSGEHSAQVRDVLGIPAQN